MKIRNGFVSNSSSSSFIAILTEEQNEELLQSVDDIQKEILKYLSDGTTDFVGMKCHIYSGEVGYLYESFCIDDHTDLDDKEFEEEYGYEMCPNESFHRIKFPSGCIKKSISG